MHPIKTNNLVRLQVFGQRNPTHQLNNGINQVARMQLLMLMQLTQMLAKTQPCGQAPQLVPTQVIFVLMNSRILNRDHNQKCYSI